MRLPKTIALFLIFGIATGVYISTMEPSVGLIDSGELALACSEPGIAHPTGYPFFCLLGRFFNMLNGLEAVVSSNLFSAVSGGLAATVVFLILSLLLTHLAKTKELWVTLISAAGAFAFAFSQTFWATAITTEVYTLETVITLTAFYFMLKWFLHGNPREFLLSSFIFGLSFGVHMLTLLYAPAVFVLLIAGRRRLSIKLFLCSLGLFIIGLSVYLYLPIRASCSPFMNFGDPSSLERFIRHITAWQYRVWMFNRPAGELWLSLKNFAKQLYGDATVFSLPLVALGVVFFFKKRALAIALGSIFIFDILYSMNYSIPDIESYLILAVFIWFTFITAGFVLIIQKFRVYFVATIVSLLVFVVPAVRWRALDRSDYYFAQEIAENILALAPKNSIVYLNNWDYYAPAKYLQHARNYRSDLVLLDFELMRRSWYLENLLKLHPEALSNSRPQIEDFITKVKPFERKQAYSARVLELAWREMHFSIVNNSLNDRPVCGTFFGGEMERLFAQYPKGGCGVLSEIGDGRFVPPTAVELTEFKAKKDRLTPREAVMAGIYEQGWLSAAVSHYNSGRKDLAALFLRADIEHFPTNWNSYKNLAVLLIEDERFEEAIEVFKQGEPYIPAGSYPQMIYDDLNRRIHQRDSLKLIGI